MLGTTLRKKFEDHCVIAYTSMHRLIMKVYIVIDFLEYKYRSVVYLIYIIVIQIE